MFDQLDLSNENMTHTQNIQRFLDSIMKERHCHFVDLKALGLEFRALHTLGKYSTTQKCS